MKEAFIGLLNMCIPASIMIVAVIAFRLVFRKAPKVIVRILWCLVGLRLICPVMIKSPLSLIPSQTSFVVKENNEVRSSTGISGVDDTLNRYLMQECEKAGGEVISNGKRIITSKAATVLLIIWAAGIAVLLSKSLISYLKLKTKLRESVRYEEGVYQTDKLTTPLVFGIVHPVIYVPFKLSGEQLECVVMHEKTHIKRKDYLIKPLGYILFSVYWFNPLVWVAYALFCHDVEMACDEMVIDELGHEKKGIYARTLLECSAPESMLMACPVAFAEVGVKERIVNVMKMGKSKSGVVISAVLVAVAIAVFFMTNPVNASQRGDYKDEKELNVTAAEEINKEEIVNDEKTADTLTVKDEETVTENSDAKEDYTVTSEASNNEAGENSKEESKETIVTELSLVCPIPGDGMRITMAYSEKHKAVDWAAALGTPLVASFDGSISATGFDTTNGNYIVIKDAEGNCAFYNHCDTVDVKVDQVVTAGTQIGTLGATGSCTGPCLHFAVSDTNGEFIDPQLLIK